MTWAKSFGILVDLWGRGGHRHGFGSLTEQIGWIRSLRHRSIAISDLGSSENNFATGEPDHSYIHDTDEAATHKGSIMGALAQERFEGEVNANVF
jgi:hypothetical protein